jgi:hypothetical protein|tara:strand:- start:10060 stop:11967 length:1908 start_codon:yes stop_codon:yes gene_type:complete
MNSILTFDNKGYIKAHSNGRNGHTLKSSIMELLQNADDACPSNIMIKYREKGNLFIIADNGSGMPINKLESMSVLYRHDKSSPNKHGKFGIGAKEAFLTLGGRWRVLTKEQNSSDISKLEWNSDSLIKWSNNELEYGKYVSTSDNASENLRKFYFKTMKKLNTNLKPKEIHGTVVVGEMGDFNDDEKNELVEQLKDIIRNITIKHQKNIPKISYDIDLFDDYLNSLTEIEPLDWLNYNNVDDANKIRFNLGIISGKNRRIYYNYYINNDNIIYKFSKNNFLGFARKEKLKDIDNNFIQVSITILDENMIKEQERELRTERQKLCGILVNRNNHYLYTNVLEWKLKNISTNFRCELKYDNSIIDDIFKVKMNKSNFAYSHVDKTLKKLMEYVIHNITKSYKKTKNLKESFEIVLEMYETSQEEASKEIDNNVIIDEIDIPPIFDNIKHKRNPEEEVRIIENPIIEETLIEETLIEEPEIEKDIEKEMLLNKMSKMEAELERVLAKEENYIELEKQIEVLKESESKKGNIIIEMNKEIERLQQNDNYVEEIIENPPKESNMTSKEIVNKLITRFADHKIIDAEEEIGIFKNLLSSINDKDIEIQMPNSKKLFGHLNESLRKLVKSGLINRESLLRQL